VVTEIAGAGTPEPCWRGWLEAAAWPALDLSGAGVPLVVAPHPDDEVLGVGGLLGLLGAGELLAVTDGEASHPGSTAIGPARLAGLRRAETERALGLLGLAGMVVHRLGQPDGAIDEAALSAALVRLLRPGRWCLATWRDDGHPDHEAVGRAAAAACADTGARLLEYPVWAWHWAAPADPRLPWHRLRQVRLPARVLAVKAAAVAAFRSQTEPLGPAPADAAVLPVAVLDRFRRPYEVLFGPPGPAASDAEPAAGDPERAREVPGDQ
jgi:LmbE family N-acetylglucosaminyl deacetylase